MILPWLEDPWNEFAARLEQDRLPHALLLAGPAGTGKRRLADRMVAGLLCEEGGPDACGRCRSCQVEAGGAHPDRFLVHPEDDKRIIGVEAVRKLIENMVLTRTLSPRKVARIEPAEAMNRNAANALLKTLEEPLGDAVILLVADDSNRLPATILSRCQALPVRAPSRAQAVDWLSREGGIDVSTAALALDATADSPLAALELASTDSLARFQALQTELAAVIGKPSRVASLGPVLKELDGDVSWTWLSLLAGKALANVLGASDDGWPQTGYTLPPARLAHLQRRADRNRAYLASSVRQDLLMKEWLLEWARLPAAKPIQ